MGGLLEPIVERYRAAGKRIYSRADAAFAFPDIAEIETPCAKIQKSIMKKAECRDCPKHHHQNHVQGIVYSRTRALAAPGVNESGGTRFHQTEEMVLRLL